MSIIPQLNILSEKPEYRSYQIFELSSVSFDNYRIRLPASKSVKILEISKTTSSALTVHSAGRDALLVKVGKTRERD